MDGEVFCGISGGSDCIGLCYHLLRPCFGCHTWSFWAGDVAGDSSHGSQPRTPTHTVEGVVGMNVAVALLAAFLIGAGPSDATAVQSWGSTATVQETVQEAPPPKRRADQQTRDVLFALAMGLAIFSSSLALGIAYGIRRRIDQIAGPPDDEDD
jgi:hypothetical protein